MKTLEEYIAESIQMYICERFDIDRARKVVSFNANRQDNVDTNDYIKQSVRFAVKWLDEDFDKLSDMMNNKDVLILDDTVATGKTLSDCDEAIRATFAPRSVTFLTLFSPKSSKDYSNNRVIL